MPSKVAKMPRVTRASGHLDDFVLLQKVQGRLAVSKRSRVAAHLASCRECSANLREIEALHSGLAELAASGELREEGVLLALDDPFRNRPAPMDHRSAPLLRNAMLAADRGLARAKEIIDRLEATERPEKVLRSFVLEQPEDRFAIYFALQEAVLGSPGTPGDF